MNLDDKKILCRLVGQLLITDLVLTDDEHDFLDRLMDRLELSEADQREVKTHVDLDQDTAALAASLGPERREEVLAVLREAAESDGAVAAREAALIAAVEGAL